MWHNKLVGYYFWASILMFRELLVHLVIVTALVVAGESLRRPRRKLGFEPVYVEINPNIIKLKEMVKMDLKRGKSLKKLATNLNEPKLALELTPEFFGNPELKRVFSAITHAHDGRKAAKTGHHSDVKLIFQINPLLIAESELRHESGEGEEETDKQNKAAFALNLHPLFPERIPPIREFSRKCKDKKIEEFWCAENRAFSLCEPVEPTKPLPTVCKPTIPCYSELFEMLPDFCRIDFNRHLGSPDPCDCGTTSYIDVTPYKKCKSSLAPTVMPPSSEDTPYTCKSVARVEDTTPLIHPPKDLITQKCCLSDHEDKSNFVLAKRFPSASWSRRMRRRRKRENFKRKFK